jgi:branched-subunit amino acid aminotransferase/4-amino-4-deoxychorismate lyase
MAEPRVATFESGPAGLRPLGRHASLAASSAALPAGAYTSLRTYGGRGVVRLAAHFRRLEESTALQGRPGSIDPAAARRAIAAAVDATPHGESRLRLTFAPPRLFVAVEPFTPLPARLYAEGVACVTLAIQRDNPHAKDTRFIATAHGAYGSLPDGVHEGLLVAADGSLLEGLSSNFFAVRQGVLHTEEERVLLGVTRGLVLELAREILPTDPTALRRAQLAEVSEAFLTSVSREVLPVVQIDGQVIGDGHPGPQTRALMQAFADLVSREARPL